MARTTTRRYRTNVEPSAFAIDVRDGKGNGLYPDARTLPEALRIAAEMIEQYPTFHVELFARTMDSHDGDTYRWHETRILEHGAA